MTRGDTRIVHIPGKHVYKSFNYHYPMETVIKIPGEFSGVGGSGGRLTLKQCIISKLL